MIMEVVSRWDDVSAKYMTVEFDDYSRVDVKKKENGYMYIMHCENGYDVYRETGYANEGFRFLTDEEKDELLLFADAQFERENEY